MWIFEHNFVADKEKIRRRAVARQENLPQGDKRPAWAVFNGCEYRFLLRLFAHIDIDGVFTRKQRVDVKGIGKFKPAAVVVEMRNDAVA